MGNKVLIWKSERGSRICFGSGHTQAFNPTAQTTNNEDCPVHYHKKFKSHHPEEMNNADSPFFLAINHRGRPGNNIWYMKAPLGKNMIGKLMKTAAQAAGLPTSFPGSLSPRPQERETLLWSGHVRPKIWDVANKRLVGGADECEFCLYLV